LILEKDSPVRRKLNTLVDINNVPKLDEKYITVRSLEREIERVKFGGNYDVRSTGPN
jgi:hypothetical protein